MIAIFTVLGFGLLGSGLYAIYSGWPYLVLERGFTQVIIGTVVATGGLILLALAWVLREIKAVRRELAEAGERRHAEFEPAAVPLAVPLPYVDQPRPTLGPTVGLGAAAVAAGAVAAAVTRHEEEGHPQGKPEQDLFGSLVADSLADRPSSEAAEEESEASDAEDGKPVADLFAAKEELEPADGIAATRIEPESDEPPEVVAAMVQPLSHDEALAKTDLAEAEPIETGFTNSADLVPAQARHEPTFGEMLPLADDSREPEELPPIGANPEHRPLPPLLEPVEAPTATKDEPATDVEIDEFSALRESLTSQLGAFGRSEARSDPAKDPFALADEARSPVEARREPFFEQPVAQEPEPVSTETAAPAWPPRTSSEQRNEEAGDMPAPTAAMPDELEASATPADALEAPTAEDASPDEAQAPEAEQPASSEEGIVGAYQVGDANFTIYADGSIRARTPDGEYSFASMDELKVYLASEKSRLGV